jgi:hypothetical protein
MLWRSGPFRLAADLSQMDCFASVAMTMVRLFGKQN